MVNNPASASTLSPLRPAAGSPRSRETIREADAPRFLTPASGPRRPLAPARHAVTLHIGGDHPYENRQAPPPARHPPRGTPAAARARAPGAARDTALDRVQRLLQPLAALPPAAAAAPAPQSWAGLVALHHPGTEGEGLRRAPEIRRWAGHDPQRLQALHLLFAHSEAQVAAGHCARGFLDGLLSAYQAGTTADEHRLQPDRTVATLACALGSGISPARLRLSVARTRYGAELLRSVVGPLMIYMPLGWGGNSLLAAKWAEERARFSPAEKFWTTFLLATLIGLGEFMNAVARQAGAGPAYTRSVTCAEVDGSGQQIVPANDFLAGVRATAFVWFLPGLALVHRFLRHEDAGEQQERQAEARFWVGMACTLAVALHNYLLPVAARVQTITALDGRSPDDFRAHVSYMSQPPWRGSLDYLAGLARGLGRAFWSPDPQARTFGQKLWSAMPESTTVLRFMLRTGFSHLLLNVAPMVAQALKDSHGYSDEEASYRAGLLAFAGISAGWGPAMELTHQLCQRIGRSAEREQALAARLREAHALRLRDAAVAAVLPPPRDPPLE